MVHAQLNHSYFVARAQPQQGQGHANVVVEITLRGQHGIGHMRAKDGGDHLRHRGLAVAAGDGYQRQAELRTPAAGQLAQGQFGVCHHQPWQASSIELGLRMAQRGYGAFGFGLCQEIVGIKALALQRHKQVARLDAAGVGVHALQHGRAVPHQPGILQPLRGLLQRQHAAHESPPSFGDGDGCDTVFGIDSGVALAVCVCAGGVQACNAWATCTRSENGCLTPAISW